MKHSYKNDVDPYAKGFTIVKIDPGYVERIYDLVNDIVERKATEEHHKIDNQSEFKRFTTGFLGEAAIEKLFGINVIDWSIGDSKSYHVPDVPGYSVGIKTVEYGKFPIIFKNNYYPQIMCIRSIKEENVVAVCGLATKDILNTYQDDDLILDANLRARGTKTGFYGFGFLKPVNTILDIKEYKKVKRW